MDVLYISNRSLVNKSEAVTWFQAYCEEPTLHLRTNFDDAKTFLMDQVIGKQKHIDFIITNWIVNLQTAKTLLNWIRESSETYSTYNFQFRSIPILLIEDEENQSAGISEGFNGVVTNFPGSRYRLNFAVKSAIKEWRYSLANDLDLIGLDPKTQKIYIGHRTSFISYYRLNVLSRQFVDNKSKRLNYIWTNTEITALSDSNQAFSEKMNWTMKNRPRDMEKQIHQFFLQNPTFVKGEDFMGVKNDKQSMLYEKRFYKNGTKRSDIPDFMNNPKEYSLRVPEVFEIKRQSQKILRYGREKFISNAKASFDQVKRYKKYMTSNDPQHQAYVMLHLGKLYASYEYTLLMGSISEKQEHADLIDRLKRDFEFDDINLVTYEELLERHIRLCNRLDQFNIF